MRNIIIIKTGLSESLALDHQKSIISLGDILSSTPLIDFFKEDNIFWITSPQGLPLLDGIPELEKVLTEKEAELYSFPKIDLILNLERYAPSLTISKETKVFGFSFLDPNILHTSSGKENFKYVKERLETQGKKSLQDFIFYILGQEFTGETYKLSPNLSEQLPEVSYDIGFNWKVGEKWPTKEVSLEKWNELEKSLIENNYSVSWQEGFNDLKDYVRWIAKNDLLITNDSLGLHICLALGKRNICFFGPTDSQAIWTYGLTEIVTFDVPNNYDCLPCYSNTCQMEKKCTEFLDTSKVMDLIRKNVTKAL
ncbi:MAG: hypothetical protein K9K67_01310 [Bacteriovoracaceae bacterium]|nr:hypothetical protein [Bacteriovoracaceae bacterium]